MAQKKQKQVKVKRQESYRQSKSSNLLSKYSKSDVEKIGKFYRDAVKSRPELAKMAKKIPKKSLAKRALGKAIPGAGAAIIAHDVMRAGAKKGCIKRGGEWVGGKCKVAKKPRTKTSGPDKRFAKSRSKKK